MKKLLLILLLFLSTYCFAQNLPTKQALFEGCTVIILETTDRAPDALKKIQKAFKDQGFRIGTIDKSISTVTASQTVEEAGEIQVNATINQGGSNQIILNGTLGSTVQTASSSLGTKISNTGGDKSASKRAFDKMHEVALSYKNAKILYGTD